MDSLREGNISLKILKTFISNPSFIFMFNNLSTIIAEEFLSAFGYLLNMVSNMINILI